MQTTFDPVEYAKECIEQKVSEIVPKEIIYATINIKKLMEITGYGRSTLERGFLCTEEAEMLNVSTTSKKVWLYPEIAEAWREYSLNNKK